jgi:hypothetical protein
MIEGAFEAKRSGTRNGFFGGASRDRTDDLIVANDALSQLSYSPTAEGIRTTPSFAIITAGGTPAKRAGASTAKHALLRKADLICLRDGVCAEA